MSTMTTNVTDLTIGANVRRFRQAVAMSQAQLAEALSGYGISFSQQTVLKIEKGERPLKLSEAAAISKCLGIAVQDLFETDEEASAESVSLRRARGFCDEIRMVARAALAGLDKLQHMQVILKREIEDGELGTPAVLNDPEIARFRSASLVDLLKSVQDERSHDEVDVRLAEVGIPVLDLRELIADAARETIRNG